MLALQKQSKYIQRTIKLPNGTLALVVFELVEINGKITAKAVCGKILGRETVSCEEILAFPIYFESQSVKPIISTFFGKVEDILKDLSFVISQPSRAPNF